MIKLDGDLKTELIKDLNSMGISLNIHFNKYFIL